MGRLDVLVYVRLHFGRLPTVAALPEPFLRLPHLGVNGHVQI